MVGALVKFQALESFGGGATTNAGEVIYPDTLVIPSYIHSRALKAVQETYEDSREHSLYFDFVDGRWINTGANLGTSFTVDAFGAIGANTGARDAIRILLAPPHLHLHTHPTITESIAKQAADTASQFEDWEKGQIQAATIRVCKDWEKKTPLPSSSDIGVYLSHLGGRLLNMISTDSGNFMCIINNLSAQPVNPLRCILRGPNRFMRQRGITAEGVSVAFKNVAEVHDITKREDELPSREELLKLAAFLLNTDYVSYFSDDPENPSLARV